MPIVATDKTELTPRQAEIFAWIFRRTMEDGFQPTYRDIGKRFGIGSPNALHGHLVAMVRKGWVGKVEHRNRAVRFLRTPSGAPFRGFKEVES